MVFRLRFGQPLVQILDPLLIQRVGVQELRQKAWRRPASLLLVEGAESLPERNRLFRVVARPRHINEPDVVCFGFLFSAMRQLPSHLRAYPEGGRGHRLPAGVGSRDGRTEELTAAVQNQLLADPFRAMMRHGVAYFVAEHRRETGVVLSNRQNPRVDPNFPPGQTKRIGFGAFKYHKLPLCIGQVLTCYGGNSFGDSLHHLVGRRIMIDGSTALKLVETRQPQLRFLA